MGQLVNGRMERQLVFERPEPPSLWVIVDEEFCAAASAAPMIMQDQLERLVDLAGRPNITIQVVPGDVGAHVGLLGAFAVASHNGASTVYMESPDQGQTTETPSVVAKINATFDTLRAEALPRAASRDLIRKVAEEQWTT